MSDTTISANNIYENFYDTITFTGSGAILAGTPFAMFAVPYDNATKYTWQTNQPKQNQCPYTKMFILGIMFEIFTGSVSGPLPTSDDVNKILRNCSLIIKKNTTPILEIPLIKIPAGNQIAGFATNTNNSTVGIVTNGIAHLDNMYKIGENSIGDTTQTGIPFEKDEIFDISIIAEKAFTPDNTVYGKLKFFCDTWQKLS